MRLTTLKFCSSLNFIKQVPVSLNITTLFATKRNSLLNSKYCSSPQPFKMFAAAYSIAAQGEPIEVPVPWGKLSCVAWGPKEGRPVMCVHGWLDNALSFAPLVPHLPKDWRVVSMDWSGHGQSSHWPEGAAHNITDYVYELRRVIDYLKWSNFTLIGHSMGASVCTLFTGSHPDLVHQLVLIESLHPVVSRSGNAPERLRQAVNMLMSHEGHEGEHKVYSEQLALDRLLESNKDLTEKEAKLLLYRGTVKVDGGVMFTRDHRVKLRSPMQLTEEQGEAFVSSVKCDTLLIEAEDGPRLYMRPERKEKLLKILNASCTKFDHVLTTGGHHCHMTEAEKIAGIVTDFLSTPSSQPFFASNI